MFLFSGSALSIESVDTLKENNQTAHHTDEFEEDFVVVRRGQAFSLKLKFDRKVDKDQDVIVIKFAYGMTIIFIINVKYFVAFKVNFHLSLTAVGSNPTREFGFYHFAVFLF